MEQGYQESPLTVDRSPIVGATEQSPINRELETQEKSIMSLQLALEQLEKKLGPILRPEAETGEKLSNLAGDPAASLRSDVTTTLADSNRRINRAATRVSQITNRLDV